MKLDYNTTNATNKSEKTSSLLSNRVKTLTAAVLILLTGQDYYDFIFNLLWPFALQKMKII